MIQAPQNLSDEALNDVAQALPGTRVISDVPMPSAAMPSQHQGQIILLTLLANAKAHQGLSRFVDLIHAHLSEVELHNLLLAPNPQMPLWQLGNAAAAQDNAGDAMDEQMIDAETAEISQRLQQVRFE